MTHWLSMEHGGSRQRHARLQSALCGLFVQFLHQKARHSMTTAELKSRRAASDERDLKAADLIVAAGFSIVVLAWVGLLAHWGSML